MNATTQLKTVIGTQGIEATNFAATLKASSLDWEPLSDSVAGMDTGIQMPRKKLLYRSDNKAPLGIVGTDYFPSDPREFVKGQFEFAEFAKGRVTQVGFIPVHAQAFAFVQLDKVEIPRPQRKVGDPVQVYLYSRDGWDGGTPRQSRLYVERLRCANGMASRELAASLWVSHTSGMLTHYEYRWKEFLAAIRATVDSVRQQFVKLAQERMSGEQMKAFLEKLLPGESTRTTGKRDEILGLFGEGGTGNEGNSRWDAYNAVTEYVTHRATYREMENTSTELNRFIGVVEKNRLGERALSLLLN